MRAVTITSYGGPEVVRVQDVPDPPPPGPGEIQLRVRAAALNHLDLFVIRGLPGVQHSFPHTVGSDISGEVVSVGARVSRVRPGDSVLVNPGSWCGSCELCAAGEECLCERYGVRGEQGAGLFSELVNLPESNVERVAAGHSWAEAAAYPLATLTAWRMLVTRAQLKPGESVLIWGIGGGVALQALQVAKHVGARVIVTSSSDAKLERARQLGADAVVNHGRDDVPKAVRAFSGKRGADVVVDCVGQATWEISTRALARTGRLVTCGGTSGPLVTMDVRKLFWHHWSILGSTMGNTREFRRIAELFSSGELKPVVDSVIPFDQARSAFERLERGEQFGKVVLEVA
ncbi:MAG TPA: zinc-binding dehydrogenase [Gemmatimonadales bacterium]|nr:zinc-binding dehydrogenase [Gemmatimonadales bacterium]